MESAYSLTISLFANVTTGRAAFAHRDKVRSGDLTCRLPSTRFQRDDARKRRLRNGECSSVWQWMRITRRSPKLKDSSLPALKSKVFRRRARL